MEEGHEEADITKVDEYRVRLRRLKEWEPFLKKESGLPGPRGNLELAQAVALEADTGRIDRLLSSPGRHAPENTPEAFVLFCGVISLGKHITRREPERLRRLRTFALDARWRIREAVAMALQYVGDEDMDLLVREARLWSKGDWLEKRAAAAGLCEPRLLKNRAAAESVLRILDAITKSMVSSAGRASEEFKVLRQGMGYCWSVAVAAAPAAGKPFIEKWIKSSDPDIRWIMKTNLGKDRLSKMDAKWVKSMQGRMTA